MTAWRGAERKIEMRKSEIILKGFEFVMPIAAAQNDIINFQGN
jgi:hypothetical protein